MEELEYEGETGGGVLLNEWTSSSLTPQTCFSSVSRRSDTNHPSDYTDQCDPTGLQPDINHKDTQGATKSPEPDLGSGDEILTAAESRGMPDHLSNVYH